MLTKALKNIILRFINLYLYLKEFVLNYALLLKQLYNYAKQSQYLLLSSILITRTTNTVSIRLIAPIEAADKGKNKTTIYIEAVEGVYTEETNNIEETREQDSRKRDTISVINQAISLLSILLKSERRHTRNSVNMLYIYQRRRLPQNIIIAFSPSIKELRELTTLRLNLMLSSLC